jgi:UDP-N-acetylmuramate dehydrogenase
LNPQAERFATVLGADRVRVAEPMCRHTSFRIGGPADILVLPRDTAELKQSLIIARELGLPILILGNGSNLLVRDGGIRGVVIKLAGCGAGCSNEGTHLTAGAGLLLTEVAVAAAEAGLSGLEFAAGIPGTVGGGVVMNAGAYDGEMKDIVARVVTIDADGGEHIYSQGDLGFGPRESILQHRAEYVTSVTFALRRGDRSEILAKMRELNQRRQDKQPLDLPSAGSVFRRPPGHYAGDLIQRAGLKGRRVGGAQVSEKHAGFIVNQGGATASDVLTLIAEIQHEVERQFGVWLMTEIKVVGTDESAQ